MKHVLLIDDNEMDNYISEHIIRSSKKAEKISVNDSAVEALDYLRKLQQNKEEFPDIIFLDVRMPVMDGFEFLEEFSKFPETVIMNTSIFMLSSSADPKDKDHAKEYSSVKKFLTKPLSAEYLNELI